MDGFRIAQNLTKNHAKTFYFASLFLKKEKRKAAYAIYAICRISDDSVDTQKNISPEQTLSQIKKNIDSAYNDDILTNPLLIAFRHTIKKYGIPKMYFDELISGMYMDLTKKRYKNFKELYEYCYKVAGVVGLIMLHIFGYKNSQAQKHAVDLGIAMQLTNIIRDIKEDYMMGRIYLPKDEMDLFGITEEIISENKIDDKFKEFLKFQIKRARKYYANAKLGIKMINDLNSRFVVLSMADIYAGILNDIENNNYDIFSRRAHVSLASKIFTVIKILFKINKLIKI